MIAQQDIDNYVSRFNVESYLTAKQIPFTRSHRGWVFCSPLRNEHNASAVIFFNTKQYWDFATEEKMTLPTFISKVENVDFKRAIEIISGASYKSFVEIAPQTVLTDTDPVGEYSVLKDASLFRYTQSRGISTRTALKYLSQCHWKGKYNKIAFRNDKGGYAIRNNQPDAKQRWFNDGPNRPTTISHNSDAVCIFEGTFDFLSWVEYMNFKKKSIEKFDCITLNSVSNYRWLVMERQLDKYNHIFLWLDADKAGRDTTAKLIAEYPLETIDMTAQFLPPECKDFGDFWLSIYNNNIK